MATAKITKLTAEQEQRLVMFREEQRAIGTRTGHDAECESTGRAAINDAYQAIGVEPPALVLWAQSPLQALLMHWALRGMLERKPDGSKPDVDLSAGGSLGDHLGDQLGDHLRGQFWGQLWDHLGDHLRGQFWGQLRGQLGGQLWDHLGGQLWDQLGDQLRGQFRGQLGDQLGDHLWDQLWGQLGGQLGDQLGGQLRGQLWGQLGDQLRGQLWGQLRDQLGGQLGGQLWGHLGDQLGEAYQQTWCWGQCESYWTAYYRFAISVGVKVTADQDRRLQVWERLARSTFMVLSWRGVSILVQHPTVAKFDDRKRLHCVDGPVLAWPDGYAVYSIHGIRLTPERGAAVAAGKLSASEIRDEPNAEVRRVLVSTYNAGDTGRYLRDIGATAIHTDVDALGLPRRLLRVEQQGDEVYLAIEVTNSTSEPDGTRKLYTFRCDPSLRPHPDRGACHANPQPQSMTCQNAIASTYGYYGHEYQPVIET